MRAKHWAIPLLLTSLPAVPSPGGRGWREQQGDAIRGREKERMALVRVLWDDGSTPLHFTTLHP